VNMESLSDRGAAMKQLLLQGYKEKLFADANITAGQEKNQSEFSKAFLDCMSKQSSLLNKGVTTETLTMIRSRFILEWFDKYAGGFRINYSIISASCCRKAFLTLTTSGFLERFKI